VADAEAVRDDIVAQFDDVTAGEGLLYDGTLLDFLTGNPFDPNNNQLGFPLSGDVPAEDGGGTGRNCFSATRTHCISSGGSPSTTATRSRVTSSSSTSASTPSSAGTTTAKA
jgi:hypothetical protein